MTREGAAADAGSLLVVGVAGTELGRDEAAALEELEPAGVILFGRNMATESQVRRLIDAVRRHVERPLVLLDQEGGRVDRLRALRGRSPSARELAREGRGAVAAAASATATALASLGVNFNCAPVVDLDEGHEGNGIGDRSFGTDPEEVADLARALIEAHEIEGIATSLKHFPGLGRTGEDTHETLPTVRASRGELRERDVVPFRLLADRAASVMVSHAAFPGVEDVPASCSGEVISGMLRRELGFEGVVATDDLEMGAVSGMSPGARAVAALNAGADLLLFCSDWAQARAALGGVRDALHEGGIPAASVADSVARVRALRNRVR